ncbi:monothiol glutaredoxin-S1-like [Chenopodium quinoa]|uniref:monothiol glutaredoxin-S1-like n=1 Tax=Chenopodium quinoa TaxID=63459 RepID=UPI000B76D3BA|nr:monothiol glutaredoxin-S1-like [Chenopodium quinoa]
MLDYKYDGMIVLIYSQHKQEIHSLNLTTIPHSSLICLSLFCILYTEYSPSILSKSRTAKILANLQAMDVVNRLVEQKPLVIFTKSSCCISHSVMQLISSYGANAEVYELDNMSNGKEVDKALQRLGLRPSVPAVFIGQKLVGGAKEIISLQVQGRLVPMLKEAGALWV